jgi:hypothetical protein
MMTADIERVAKAIYYDFCSPLMDAEKPFWSQLPKAARDFLLSQARAGMIDLRTPSEAMLSAGADLERGASPAAIWTAMMDAALGEKVTAKNGD